LRGAALSDIIAEKEAALHELSVAQSICERVAERAGAAVIEEMTVEVGALSGVNCEALQFVLGEAADMCGVRLGQFRVEPVPARARCACGRDYEARQLIEPCPQCGGFDREITDGEQVTVTRLLVVEDDGEAN